MRWGGRHNKRGLGGVGGESDRCSRFSVSARAVEGSSTSSEPRTYLQSVRMGWGGRHYNRMEWGFGLEAGER